MRWPMPDFPTAADECLFRVWYDIRRGAWNCSSFQWNWIPIFIGKSVFSLDNLISNWFGLFYFSRLTVSRRLGAFYVRRKDNVNALKLTYQPLVDFLIHRIMTSWIHNKIAEAKEQVVRLSRVHDATVRGETAWYCVLEFITHNLHTVLVHYEYTPRTSTFIQSNNNQPITITIK